MATKVEGRRILWVDDEIKLSDLKPYEFPCDDEIESVGLKAHYFGYYHKWSAFENYKYARDHWDFVTIQDGFTEFPFPQRAHRSRLQ